MAKRPAMQFYPADWRANAKLRRCSFAERGIWLEVMCLMHDNDEYGVLRWPLKDIAQAIGCNVKDLRALRAKEVLKGADDGEQCAAFAYRARHAGQEGEPVELIPAQEGPIWFSSRMVRDEYVRSTRGAATRFGPKEQPAPPPNQRDGATPKPSPTRRQGDGSSSSSSSSKRTFIAPFRCAEDAARFARWYAIYPQKVGRGQAEKAWARIQPNDELTARMIDAVSRQTAHRKGLADSGEFVPAWKYPGTWLNAKAWEDDTNAPSRPAAPDDGRCECGALGVVKSAGRWRCSNHREAA